MLTTDRAYQIPANMNNVHTAGKKKVERQRWDRGVHEATERPIHDKSLNGLKVLVHDRVPKHCCISRGLKLGMGKCESRDDKLLASI